MGLFGKKPDKECRTIDIVIPQHVLQTLLQPPGQPGILMSLRMEERNAMIDINISSSTHPYYDKAGPFVANSYIRYVHAN